jgi:mRNA (guanine-N7-)-methyltransferase
MATPGRRRQLNPPNPSTSRPTPLPTYQPQIHPLHPNAQRDLRELPRAHRLDGLQNHLTQAINNLTAAAGDINDRSQRKTTYHEKRKARRQARDGVAGAEGEDVNDIDGAVEEMRVHVAEMTQDLEQRIRKIVDAKAAVEAAATALKELDTNLSNGRGTIAPTQSTLGASQLREKQRRANVDLSDDEDEGEIEGEDEVTGSRGPLGVLKRKMMDFQSEYENSSMRHRYVTSHQLYASLWKPRNRFEASKLTQSARYASNNDYIGFKKIVHDACNPEHDAKPMPHASTWFPASHSSSPNRNGSSNQNNHANHSRNAAQDADDAADDDDIEVAAERISISCPITLQPMKVPVSSSVCPHSFERAAVLEMISKSHIRQRVTATGSANNQNLIEQHIRCPVSGCNAVSHLPPFSLPGYLFSSHVQIDRTSLTPTIKTTPHQLIKR